MTRTDAEAEPASRDRENRLPDPVRRLFNVKRSYVDAAFTLVLLAFVGTLLVQTVDYGSQTRLVPLVIGVPIFAMLAFLLVIQLSPRVATVAGRYAAGDLFGDVSEQMDELKRGRGGDANDAIGTNLDNRLELLVVVVWVLVLFALVGLVGFIAGTFVYLVAFYRLRAGQDWLHTVLYAVVVWLFAVVAFKAILNTPLYEGLLGIEVPLPV